MECRPLVIFSWFFSLPNLNNSWIILISVYWESNNFSPSILLLTTNRVANHIFLFHLHSQFVWYLDVCTGICLPPVTNKMNVVRRGCAQTRDYANDIIILRRQWKEMALHSNSVVNITDESKETKSYHFESRNCSKIRGPSVFSAASNNSNFT